MYEVLRISFIPVISLQFQPNQGRSNRINRLYRSPQTAETAKLRPWPRRRLRFSLTSHAFVGEAQGIHGDDFIHFCCLEIHRFRNTTNLTNKSDWTNICSTCLYMYSVEILGQSLFSASHGRPWKMDVFPSIGRNGKDVCPDPWRNDAIERVYLRYLSGLKSLIRCFRK